LKAAGLPAAFDVGLAGLRPNENARRLRRLNGPTGPGLCAIAAWEHVAGGNRIVGSSSDRVRRLVAVAVTPDGRRIPLPARPLDLLEVSLLSLLRILLVGVEDIVVLITGSRRENGGTRRDGRR
jgi:hypothetical protein